MFASLREFFAAPMREATQLQREHLAEHQGLDGRCVSVMIVTAIALTLRAYFFHVEDLLWIIARVAPHWPGVLTLLQPENIEFTRLAYWALGQDLLYVGMPLLVIKCVYRDPLSDYGVKRKGMFQYAAVYGLMFLVMAPLIVWLSHTDSFQRSYPFYKLAPGEPLWPKIFVWELLYASQFIALEFFFRGFMIHGTKRQFGPYCVLVMMVPYCMIHFTKPLPETFGAIIAGVVLGLMSLKTRSIWLGAALHIAVAWSMDVAALLSR